MTDMDKELKQLEDKHKKLTKKLKTKLNEFAEEHNLPKIKCLKLRNN